MYGNLPFQIKYDLSLKYSQGVRILMMRTAYIGTDSLFGLLYSPTISSI